MVTNRMKVFRGKQRTEERNPSDFEYRSQDELIAAITKELKKKCDARAIGYQSAQCYLDWMARIRAWTLQLDTVCGGRLFPTDSSVEASARRMVKLLSIYNTLFELEQEAIQGLINCLGGWELISLEGLLIKIRESGTGTFGPLEQEIISRIAERMVRRA